MHRILSEHCKEGLGVFDIRGRRSGKDWGLIPLLYNGYVFCRERERERERDRQRVRQKEPEGEHQLSSIAGTKERKKERCKKRRETERSRVAERNMKRESERGREGERE